MFVLWLSATSVIDISTDPEALLELFAKMSSEISELKQAPSQGNQRVNQINTKGKSKSQQELPSFLGCLSLDPNQHEFESRSPRWQRGAHGIRRPETSAS